MLKTLLGIRFGSLFSAGAAKADGRKRSSTVGIIIIALLLIASISAFFFSIATPLALVLIPTGLEAYYFAIFNMLTFAVVFVLSVFETKSELFECRDNELLLSMPIRPRDIVLSRSVTLLILNAIEALVVIIPAVIMYVVAGGGAIYIPSAIIVALLISVLATALSSAVGYLVALISARLKHHTIITVVLSLGFLALYFIAYGAFMDAISLMENDPNAAGEAIASSLGSVSALGNISLLKPVETITFVVISVGLSLFGWFVISKNYIKIITTKASVGKKAYVRTELSHSSALAALSKKELITFFSNATYILNGMMGSVFQIAVAVMLLVSRDSLSLVSTALVAIGGEGIMELAAAVVLVGLSSMSTISASALSLEGKNFWIIKSSPIPARTVIHAKLVPHLLLTVPASLISSVIAAIAIEAAPIWWVFILILPVVADFVFAMLGLILNIAMPKLEFSNSAQVVKQSMPVFIVTVGGMLGFLILGALALGLAVLVGSALSALILAAVFVALLLVFYLILTGPSERRFEKL